MPDRTAGKLGRLPGKVPVGLHTLGTYVAGALPQAPESVTVPSVTDWQVLGNDTVGDCGVAGLEHGFMADAAIAGEHEQFPTTTQAVSYYLSYTHGADTGVVLSDYLAYVRSNPFYGHSVDVFAPVDVHDVPTLQFAVWAYGFAYTGIVVTRAMQEAFGAGQPWTSSAASGQVLGGHCVPAVGYDDDFLYVVTWGGVQKVTWPAWHRISEEAYAVVTGEFVERGGDGRGVTLAALRSDLNRLAA